MSGAFFTPSLNNSSNDKDLNQNLNNGNDVIIDIISSQFFVLFSILQLILAAVAS